MTGSRALAGHLGRCALGCATFGREIDADASFAMMDRAVALGIKHFDTAAAYSAGLSEALVGRWLAARRGVPGPLVATKIKPPYHPAEIRRKVSESRERLGLAKIDLLYLHQWSDELRELDSLRALDQLVAGGEVGYLGVSNLTASQLRPLLTIQRQHGLALFQALQNNHNFAVRDVDAELRQLCAEADVALVTYSPLGAGFLTGKHKAGVEAGSRFAVIPGHQQVYFQREAWARLAELESLARETGEPLAVLALIWAFNQPGAATVLVGGRSPAHLDQAFAALARGRPAWLDRPAVAPA